MVNMLILANGRAHLFNTNAMRVEVVIDEVPEGYDIDLIVSGYKGLFGGSAGSVRFPIARFAQDNGRDSWFCDNAMLGLHCESTLQHIVSQRGNLDVIDVADIYNYIADSIADDYIEDRMDDVIFFSVDGQRKPA